MGISTGADFLLLSVISLGGGLLCVLRPESVRIFATRYSPGASEMFGGAEAHCRFIRFCGWALLALASNTSLVSLMVER
jgi:hypothetical protein